MSTRNLLLCLNFKICDNSLECDALRACPVGAIKWDENKKAIVVQQEKCIDCGSCARACMAGAIKVATGEEFEKIKKAYTKDKRKISDLFIERYGAAPIDKSILVDEKEFDEFVKNSKGLVVGEFFNENLTQCLIKSIPIKKLFDSKKTKYFKVKFNKNTEPSLHIFKDGKMIGKIDGYYEYMRREELIRKIKSIL